MLHSQREDSVRVDGWPGARITPLGFCAQSPAHAKSSLGDCSGLKLGDDRRAVALSFSAGGQPVREKRRVEAERE